MRRGVMAGLLGTTAVGALLLLGLPADLFGRAPAQTGTVAAIPAQVAVVDGQTLRIGEASAVSVAMLPVFTMLALIGVKLLERNQE